MMETVSLTLSPTIPTHQPEKLFSAVKIDKFYLTSGATFAPLLNCDCGNDTEDNIKRSFRQFFCNLKLWALLPPNGELQYNKRDHHHHHHYFHLRPISFTTIHWSRSIERTLQNHFHDIKFENSKKSNAKWRTHVFAMFILFSETAASDAEFLQRGLQQIHENVLSMKRSAVVGLPVAVISTPFNLMILHNSFSRGVISGTFGYENCLMLIDVKLTAGCEGSPIFSLDNRLIGFVLDVFTWVKGEWTGFSLAVQLHLVIEYLVKMCSPYMNSMIISKQPDSISTASHHFPPSDLPVFLVSTTNSWGSGVLINKRNGVIVTCSHVVGYNVQTPVEVMFGGKNYTAKIIYATSEGIPFDLAVIQINPTEIVDIFTHFNDSSREMSVGQSVRIIGYPLFSPRTHTVRSASIMHGYVSKVYSNVMAVTSCVSNGGVSGGAVIGENSELLGIASNNLLADEGNLLIPHITITIPCSVFLNSVRRFCATNELEELNNLSSDDEQVRDIWHLRATSILIPSKL